MSLTKILALKGKVAITVDDNHKFATDTARDTYFSAHLAEKKDGTYIVVGSSLQQLESGTWQDKSTVITGATGEKGEKGDSYADVPYTVGTGGVNAYQVVFISTSNTIMAANSANITHAGKIVGIATASGLAGASVAVQQMGQVVNPSWNLSAGSVYYLDAGGNITAVPPVLGFTQKIGVAQNSTTLFLQIESPIILN